MYLRADQYEQIVSQLRSERAADRLMERRASPRVGLRAQVRVIPCRAGVGATVHTAWVRDVSVEGIGLILPESLGAGTYMVVSLPGAGGTADPEATLDLLYLAVRSDALSNGQFSVGARFQRTIMPDELK